MNMTSVRQQYIHLIEQELDLSPPVRAAFLTVPRHLFVPHYYQQHGNRLQWTEVESGDEVYTNQALVTQLDASGMPSSSSSQPSVMAAMLEALCVEPGHHILEIGAGTGYNAALLSTLVGDQGYISTIDVDATLVHRAREQLALAGYPQVHVIHGDGFAGYADAAPYHRLIATGGCRNIPLPWIEQLVPGGILVANLIGNLASVLVRLTKQEDVSAIGTSLGINARFIELYHDTPDLSWKQRSQSTHYFATHPLLEQETLPFNLPQFIQTESLRFFLQCHYPHLHMQTKYLGGPFNQPDSFALCLYELEQSCVFLQQQDDHWYMQCRGHTSIWGRIKTLYEQWEAAQRPDISDYTITISPSGAQNIAVTPEIQRKPQHD